MIVVDSDIIAYLYLPGDFSEKTESLLESDADWAAPLLWRSEFRSILAGYMRRKTLTLETARELQLEAESLLAGNEYEVDSSLVLELVRDSDCSAYDCEFAALANSLGVKLVRMDAKILKAFPAFVVGLDGGRRQTDARIRHRKDGNRRRRASPTSGNYELPLALASGQRNPRIFLALAKYFG